MQGWACVAELTKAKNRKGGFVAQCAADLPFLLEEGMEVRFVPPRLDIPRAGIIDAVEMIDDRRAYVHVDSVNDLSTAELLIGCSILAREEELPYEEYSEEEVLKDFLVCDSKCGLIGTVKSIQRNPAHPLLVVEALEGAVLIPCVDEFIIDIDMESHVVNTAIPNGLLDLR